ncbi:MAG: glycine cleavage system aminomethyltransferase GcvT [Chloroflexi bacterium]|nr:glycine cleavage system aminomethyltransferase GcvT [Chloroflexota bacterium]
MDEREEKIKKTPLYQCHLDLGARMMVFERWAMPEWYSGVIDEYQAVRQAAGLFDLSHMGRLEVRGPEAFSFLQRAITNDVSRLSAGQAQYSLVCRPDGGIIDDLVYYRLPDRYLLVVNAVNAENDLNWLASLRRAWDMDGVEIADVSLSLAMMAIQGPQSAEILQRLTSLNLGTLGRYRSASGQVAGLQALIARTGYTGEDGFELYLDVGDAVSLWNRLLEEGRGEGVRPAGLGARDTLRLEAAYALYGHEIDLSTNPYGAGLGPTIKLGKGEFVGREALSRLREEVRHKLIGFEMLDRAVPRQHYPIVSGDSVVGCVSSGSYSPTLDKEIGLGYVPVEMASPGTAFDIIIRERRHHAHVVRLPFYRKV